MRINHLTLGGEELKMTPILAQEGVSSKEIGEAEEHMAMMSAPTKRFAATAEKKTSGPPRPPALVSFIILRREKECNDDLGPSPLPPLPKSPGTHPRAAGHVQIYTLQPWL